MLGIVVALALGVFIGFSINSMNSKKDVMKELLEVQEKVLASQNEMAAKLVAPAASGTSNDLTRVLMMQSQFEVRLAAIEKQVKKQESDLASMNKKRQGPPPEDFTTVYKIPLEHSYVLGKKDAAVTIYEFTDFECPFCSRFHEPLKEVLKAYPNDVNLILKNFPLGFHKNAKPAAKAAFAAGEQGKYYEMVDLLLKNQKSLSDEKYKELAKELGLKMSKFEEDLIKNAEKYEGLITKIWLLLVRQRLEVLQHTLLMDVGQSQEQ